YMIEIQANVTGAADFDAHIDAVMEHLLDLGVGDPLISTEMDRQATVTLYLETDDLEEALREGVSAIRSAVHAAGGSTAGWLSTDEVIAGAKERTSWLTT